MLLYFTLSRKRYKDYENLRFQSYIDWMMHFMEWFEDFFTSYKSWHTLEVLHGFWNKQEHFKKVHFGQRASKLLTIKVCGEKKGLDILGSRLLFSRFYIVNRCSPGDFGSKPGRRQLWDLVSLNPLYQNELMIYLWKALIYV